MHLFAFRVPHREDARRLLTRAKRAAANISLS